LTTVVVVPCYNESARFADEVFANFAVSHPGVQFVLVDDGSTDSTGEILASLARRDPEHFTILKQQENRGKAEAVRAGMQLAFGRVPTYAGYWDADLATPLSEILEFAKILEERPEIEAVFGSRVKLLGRSIRRNALRHYGGRLFATLVSLTLDLGIYDSQCGAKLFRVSPEIERLFREPFLTNWTFDVEILARLTRARQATNGPGPDEVVFERPVATWHDAPGSSVSAFDFFRGVVELARIRRAYLK
jgi:glycosyltransferase involved in cell wall biosynthesis